MTVPAAPAILRIEFRHMQALSSRGNHRIRLDADGSLFVDVVTGDCPRGTHWSGPWPGTPVRRLQAAEIGELARAISHSGFFGLPAETVRQGRDGYREELDVVLGERAHSVAIERVEPPPAFARLRSLLWRQAGLPLSG
ncbi:hypothetical protein [Thauera sinica]|uniref:Uncharacterized protein n=1 Tax=Thauera sinica TaxID=2665146 RepID=A0ABW1AX98_9RHOO|nr:hypothetical protein [Thauera sp. K11]ATE59890.1 hypothetical protein CCZ27_07940 [Thauera sp. K11]